MVPTAPPTSASAQVAVARIRWELDQFDADRPHGIDIAPWAEDRYRVEVTVLGPHGSPYEGGIFKLDWSYSPHHPSRPPIVRFLTRIYHPSVDDEGKLGLRVLGPGLWRREFTIRQILLDIKLLLLDPGTGGYPLVPGVRDLFNTDPGQFDRVARVWTRQYAGRDQASHRRAGKEEDEDEGEGEGEGEDEGYVRKKRPHDFAGPPLPPPSSLLRQPPAKRRRPDVSPEALTLTLPLPLPPPLHPITAPAQGAELDGRVGAVLEELRLAGRYRAAFEREEVSYAAFLLLDANDLAQMGLPIGPRKVLLAKIHQLCNNNEHVV